MCPQRLTRDGWSYLASCRLSNGPCAPNPAVRGTEIERQFWGQRLAAVGQSIDYAQAWVKRDLPGHLLPVDGANHFTILDTLADPQGVLSQAFLAMLRD